MSVLIYTPIGAIMVAAMLIMTTMANVNHAKDVVTPHITQEVPKPDGEVAETVKESKTPRENVPAPSNAIATPEGGYVTPLLNQTEDGKAMNIIYLTDVEKGTGGKIVPACRGPSQGLYQEGADWTTGSTNQKIGFQVNWKMPSNLDTLDGDSVGIFYNPVNYWYPISSPDYDFFQVDYGVGNNLDPREGWIMTYSYEDGSGERQYPFTTLPTVSETEGATYTVAAMHQPFPLANPSSYVVQISEGSNSWIRSEPLGYTPSLGSVDDFHSFQDQWLLSDGSSTLTRDTLTSPKVIKNVQGSLVYSGTLVTGYDTFDVLNTSVASDTRDILSPLEVDVKKYQDVRECSSWD
jgi:hypothetical protein